jgi:hypothetical protein
MAVVSGTIMALRVLGRQALKSVTKKAITGSVKKTIKGKIKDKIKDKIKSKFKKKKVKGKDISQKMFGGGEEGGGAIVASTGGSLVSAPGGGLAPATSETGGALVATKSSAAKELGLEPFMDSLTSIQTNVDSIKAALNDNNKDAKDRIEDQRLLNNKLNKEDREAALEGKKDGIGKKLLKPGKDMAEGFLSRMAKFFTSVLLGSLINALLGGAKDVILVFRIGIEALKKGMPNAIKGLKALKDSIGKGLNLIAKPFKSVGKFVGDIFVKIGNKIMGWVDDALKWVDDAIKGILNAGANAFPKIANAINQGKTFAGNLLNKGKNFIKNVGGNILNRGKNIVKNVGGGVSKWIGKLFGKNAAKAAAGPGIKTLFKSLAKGAKAIKIPVVGPLLVALMSMFAGDPIGQTLFKTAGAAIGGGLGLALGPIGMFVGEIAGEFVGDVLYEGFMGKDGWAGAGQKLKEKFMQILEGGKKVVKWIAGGIGRYVKNIITTDPLTIPEGGGRRAVATRVTKFLGLYDWLKTEGFAGGKDGQIDKFPNFLNVLFPWKSAKILVKSFFPPGEGSEEGETSASIGPQESNSDAEAVSESASYEDGGEEPTTIVDGGGEETAAAPTPQAGKGGFIPIQIGQSQDTLNILTNATLYKV